MLLLDLANKLNEQNIDYAITGGYAVNLHGATRGTVDINILINNDFNSYINIEKFLINNNFVSSIHVDSKELFSNKEKYIKEKNLIAWSFYNKDKPSEVIDIIITKDLKTVQTNKITIRGTTLKIVSIQDLINMKQESNRKQDIEDIKSLKLIMKEKEQLSKLYSTLIKKMY